MDLTSALTAAPTGERPRLDRDAGALVGGRCEDCGATSWPRRAVCHVCGSGAIAERRFGPAARLLSCTRVWVERPGVTPPYTLVEAALEDGPRVFAHGRDIPDGLTMPCPARLVIDAAEDALPPFWFVPEGEEGAR